MPIIHSHTNRKRRYIDKCKSLNISSTNVNQDYNFDIQIQTTLSYIDVCLLRRIKNLKQIC